MLVGNKCDRVTEREVSTQEGQALAKDLGCDFVEASAKNCVNVEKAFFDVVRQLRRQRHQGSGRSPSDREKSRVPRSGYHEKDRGRGASDIRRGRGGHALGKKNKEKPKCVILWVWQTHHASCSTRHQISLFDTIAHSRSTMHASLPANFSIESTFHTASA